ncbi:hypothetical protein H0H93_013590 [Arthromyces matolae]|nr:hypothetical protein H0H93_013590 [Arthromyces matolae]
MAWDYKFGMFQQRRAIETGESRLAVLIKRGLHFKAKVAQSRGNTCSPFHVPASDSPIPPLPNNVQLFDAGHREGPTAQQIAANHTVQEAFQIQHEISLSWMQQLPWIFRQGPSSTDSGSGLTSQMQNQLGTPKNLF